MIRKNSWLSAMSATLIIAVLGFCKDLILTYKYGTSEITDSFIVANNLQLIFFTGVANSIQQAYIPMYHEQIKLNLDEIGYMNRLLKSISLLLLIYSSLIFIFRNKIISIIAIGFSNNMKEMTSVFFSYQIAYGFLLSIIYIFRGYLRVKSKFFKSSSVMFFTSISIIIGILISSSKTLIYINAAYVIGGIGSLILSYKSSRSNGFVLNLKNKLSNVELRTFLALLFPIILSDIINQISVIIDQNFASTLTSGAVSYLSYANKLPSLFISLFVSSLIMVIFPIMSKASSSGDIVRSTNTYLNSVFISLLFTMPVIVLFISLANPTISFVFERGAFSRESVLRTSEGLIAYSIGLGFIVINRITISYFVTNKKTNIILSSTIITLISNVFFNFILVSNFKHVGLALGTSLSNIICSFYLILMTKKYLSLEKTNKSLISIFKLIISSIVMFFVIKITNNYLNTTSLLVSLVMKLSLGIITYILMLFLTKSIKSIRESFKYLLRQESE